MRKAIGQVLLSWHDHYQKTNNYTSYDLWTM